MQKLWPKFEHQINLYNRLISGDCVIITSYVHIKRISGDICRNRPEVAKLHISDKRIEATSMIMWYSKNTLNFSIKKYLDSRIVRVFQSGLIDFWMKRQLNTSENLRFNINDVHDEDRGKKNTITEVKLESLKLKSLDYFIKNIYFSGCAISFAFLSLEISFFCILKKLKKLNIRRRKSTITHIIVRQRNIEGEN